MGNETLWRTRRASVYKGVDPGRPNWKSRLTSPLLVMLDTVSSPSDVPRPVPFGADRHPIVVRLTHWITVFSFAGLLVSGVGILLAHPRLYWGETGALGGASMLDLPLPFMIGGPSGWGRHLHFLSAWACIPTGLVYGTCAALTRRLGPGAVAATTYTSLQRGTYLLVVFLLFPFMIWTGFAMSPALTALCPPLVTTLGGQQSARTMHFFVAGALVVFLAAHVLMVSLGGFSRRMRRMLW
jgi:thiosulfate reductase cytochrome b subunit